MAFPEDLSKVRTNLSQPEFTRVVNAIENQRGEWLSSSLYNGSVLATFKYKGRQYEVSEWFEEVFSISGVK